MHLVMGAPGCDYVTPLFYELLKGFSLQLKILIVTYKALHGKRTGYLQEYLSLPISQDEHVPDPYFEYYLISSERMPFLWQLLPL